MRRLQPLGAGFGSQLADFDVRVAHRAARTLSESVVFGSFLEFDSVELLRSRAPDCIRWRCSAEIVPWAQNGSFSALRSIIQFRPPQSAPAIPARHRCGGDICDKRIV